MVLCWPCFSDSAETEARSALLANYTRLKGALADNPYGIPLHISSTDAERLMQGDVYGIIAHDFAGVQQALSSAKNWCAITPLHFNIKACTYQSRASGCLLTLYTGRKFYEAAEDVYQLKYDFHRSANDDGYMQLHLTSARGPIGTRDYQLSIEAIPLDAGQSFIHIHYSYQYSFLTQLSMQTYLATLGRHKTGFSLAGVDAEGAPHYIQGIRGIIERNVARYYFAIHSYLDTREVPEARRLAVRLQRWYELTEKFPAQLHELDWGDYLQYKYMEWQDQLRLQGVLDASGQTHCSEDESERMGHNTGRGLP
ncbi:MAG: hypothetical protein R6X06_02590 [Gammaproteobacteria bacterium]